MDITLQAGRSPNRSRSPPSPVVSAQDAALGNWSIRRRSSSCCSTAAITCNSPCCSPTSSRPRRIRLRLPGGPIVGNSEIANNYLLDGIDNNDETTIRRRTPTLEAYASSTSDRDPFGRVADRRVGRRSSRPNRARTIFTARRLNFIVTRSLMRATSSRQPTQLSPQPVRRRDRGPIRKDRTFIFGGYEGQRRGQQEAGLANVPTLAMEASDSSAVTQSLPARLAQWTGCATTIATPIRRGRF